jgi:hypothetical protein
MEWKIVSFILIGVLVGLAVGFSTSYIVYLPDIQRQYPNYGTELSSLQSQLTQMNSQLSQMNSTLGGLMHPQPTWNVISSTQNVSWTNSDTGSGYTNSSIGLGFYDINCTGFSRMFVYITIGMMSPPSGSTTTFSLQQIVWHLYPNGGEFTWARQDVALGVLSVTAPPYLNFSGSSASSQGGAQFTVIGQYADLTFWGSSTSPAGWAVITCSIYLRNE